MFFRLLIASVRANNPPQNSTENMSVSTCRLKKLGESCMTCHWGGIVVLISDQHPVHGSGPYLDILRDNTVLLIPLNHLCGAIV